MIINNHFEFSTCLPTQSQLFFSIKPCFKRRFLKISDKQIQIRIKFSMANSLNTHFNTTNYPTLKPKLSLSMYN